MCRPMHLSKNVGDLFQLLRNLYGSNCSGLSEDTLLQNVKPYIHMVLGLQLLTVSCGFYI
jgi:hypothetical protein